MKKAGVAALLLLSGCTGRDESLPQQAARLCASIEAHRAEYRRRIAEENRLRLETLDWLQGTAVTAPRAEAVREARRFMDRWAKVYFVPRWMHERLRQDVYSSGEVRGVQARVLGHLKERYFELHDYQRYAQGASESEMHHTPAGRLPAQLREFALRLEARPAARDELAGLLDGLPCAR